MIDARSSERHRPRPHRRGLVALLLATTLTTCTTDHTPTGPGRGGRGFLAIRPLVSSPVSLAAFNLTIDGLHIVATRQPSGIALDTTVFFSPDSTTLHLALPLVLNSNPETLTLLVELLAGSKVLFSGTQSVSVSAGPPDTSAAPVVPLSYVGPGAGITQLQITPHDSVVNLGGTQLFRATATASGVPVDSFYVAWTTSDTTKAKINGQGLLKAPGARGSVFVRAVTPNTVHDSTRVTFIPTPAALTIASGNGQSATVGTRLALPLRVQVTASDALGVKGVPVKFAALSTGASVRDSVLASDSAGNAQDSVTLGTGAGPQRFTATVAGLTPDTFTVTATPGPVSTATSVVTVSSATIASGAVATLTLQAKDAFTNNLTTGGATVVFSASGGTSTGTIGSVVDHANGTYTATFTGLVSGTATTIGATINGTAVTTTLPTIAVTAGTISPLTSVVSTSSGTVSSGASATLTLQAKDAGGNVLTSGGATVVFTRAGGTSTGTIGGTTDHTNGTYTAVFTGDTAGTATTIHATIGGVAVTSTTTITVVPGNTVAAKSVITVSKDTVASGTTSTLTLQAKDSAGNNLTTGGLVVVFSHAGGTSGGTIAPATATDNNNGTYTAVFTGDIAGTATTIHATIGGQQVTSTLPTITVIPGAISPVKSIVTASDTTTTTGGVLTLTLTGKDAAGNAVTKGGATVVFTQSGGTSTGTISATTDNNTGTYTATFTGVNGGTATTIGATIGGVAVTSAPLPTIRVIATVHSADILADETWAAGTHTVTSYIRVRNGAKLTIALGAVVKFDAGAGLQIGDTALNQTGQLLMDGTQLGPAQGITLTANTGSPVPGFWKGIEVQRNLGLTTWRRTLIEWAGGARAPFGSVAAEACILFVNRSGAEVDLDSLRIRQCVHAAVHHFGGVSHIHRSEIDSVTGSGIHADFDATLQLDSTTVRGSGQEGLLLAGPATKFLPSQFNRFLGNATSGISLHAFQLPGLLRQDSIAGNGADLVQVSAGQPDPSVAAFTMFAQPQRAGSNGYVIGTGLLDIGRGGGQTLTLDSNVVLRFVGQSGLLIGDSAGTRSGSIVSLGTNRSNAPRLTSASLSPAPGDWYGLEIGRLSTNTRLDNVRVEFAGDSIPGRNKHRFAILIRSPAAQTLALDSVLAVSSGHVGSDTNTAGIGVLGSGAGVDIRRSVAQGNLGYGFAVTGVPNVKIVDDTAKANTIGFGMFTDTMGTSLFTPADSVARNVATANVLYPLSIETRRLPVLYANTFAGNGRDTALLHGGTFPFAGTLPHFVGVPWRVSGGIQIDSGGVLTLAPGDTLAFDVGTEILVGGNAVGALTADGTAGQILLTASSAPSLGWLGIDWHRPAAVGNVFKFVTVDRAGSLPIVCDCSPPPSAALRFTDTTSVNLSLDHVTVRRTPGAALQFVRGGTGTVAVTGSQFYNNNTAGSRFLPMISANIRQPDQLSISGSDLYDYRQEAIQGFGTSGDSVAATNNWWGDVMGPDSGSIGADSLGRATTAFSAVRARPFATTPFFPIGSAAGIVAAQDTILTPALSTADSIRVRVVDAFGRGVSGGGPVNWGLQPVGQTSIAPTAGSGDGGGRFDALWTFTNSAGTKIATASGPGSPAHYIANVQPGLTTAEGWVLDPARSQGSVALPNTITFTSTNRRGVIVTNAHDQFNNATQPSSLCFTTPGNTATCFTYGVVDSTHTSGGASGDTIFFHATVTTPSPFILRAVYPEALAPKQDSVLIMVNSVIAGVKIDRDPNIAGVQATPDTVLISSLCPTGAGTFACQGTYTASLVDSGLTALPSGNAVFGWNLVSGTAVTFDSQTAVFPHDVGFVTARANGVARIAVKDVSGNNFGTDTLPILVQQLPSQVLVTPDTVSVLVGGTTTFHGSVVDAAGTSIVRTVHWRNPSTFNRHLTIVDTSVANQVTVRLDSTPFGGEDINAFTAGDTAVGFGQVLNPLTLRLPVGSQPWAIAVNSQTHAVYAGHQGGQLYQLDGTTDARVDSVSAGKFVSALAVNSITNRVYAGTDLGVVVFDGTALSPITTVSAGTNQLGISNLQGLTVDSVNNRVYVAVDIGSAAPNPVLRRIDGSTNTFSATNDVPLPGHGTGAAFDPVNGLVYVAIPDSNFVVAVDPVAKTFTRILVGSAPTSVAVNSVTNRVYVADSGSADVKVIDAASGSVLATINVFYVARSLAVDAVNNRIYVGTGGVPYLLLINGTTNVYFSTLLVGNPSTDTELGVAFDAGNGKVWTANNASSSVSRVKY